MISKKRKFLINQDLFNKLLPSKIIVVDGGARGEIFFPFNRVNKSRLKVIRFEPDPNAKILESDDEIIYNKGIWERSETIKLNIAKQPSASSVFENNLLLYQEFEDYQNTIPRKVVKKVDIECESIDNLRKELNLQSIDFIKLDIHGAEYPALKGAKNTIDNCLGFVIETWTSPIHLNQKTHGSVESLLNEANFYTFDILKSYSFQRKKNNEKYFSKKQLCVLENLYLKNIQDIEINKEKILKTIAIADLYGHITYALQLSEVLLKGELISKKEYDWIEKFLITQNKKSFLYNYGEKLINRLKIYFEHY